MEKRPPPLPGFKRAGAFGEGRGKAYLGQKNKSVDQAAGAGLAPGDFYYNEQGLLVFTAQYHLKRGYCCKNGCRHCPFGFKKGGAKTR